MPHERCAHAVRRRSIVVLVLVSVVAVALALPATGSADRPACAEAVLDDWTRGTLDSSYSPECYQAAIDALPEDLRAYTTAADDIRRAAIAASRRANVPLTTGKLASRRIASDSAGGDPLRAFPTEVAVLATVLAILVSTGLVAALLRWRRSR